MSSFVRIALVTAGTLILSSAFATDYTWHGGVDLKWSTPGNWYVDGVASTEGYPVAGDTAIFSTTYVKSKIEFATETVVLGAGELTIQVNTGVNSSYVYIGTVFDGPAKLVMTGAGRRYFTPKTNKWTGGTEVRAGTLYVNGGGQESLGKGTITLKPANDADRPSLRPGAWSGLQVTNRIEIVTDQSFTKRSTTDDYSFYSSNGGSLGGPIYSDNDFVIGCGSGSGTLTFESPISAHGHTLYAFSSSSNRDRKLQFNKAVDAHLVVAKNNNDDPYSVVKLAGVSDFVDNGLTIVSGTNEFTSTSAYWGGTNIVINPNSSVCKPRLKLRSGDNLNMLATITINTDTESFIEIPSGQKLRIRRLVVNGTDVGKGTFTNSDCAFIVGGGTIEVDDFCIWTGSGTAGQWSDPANWKGGVAPKAGAVAIFNKSAGLTEEYDFGDAEHSDWTFGVDIASGMTVTNCAPLAGCNALVKSGKGTFLVQARNAYSGGTIVLDGDFEVTGIGETAATREWPMPGPGMIELRRTATTQPHLVLSAWCAVTNDVLITGPYTEHASNYGDFKFNNVSKFYGNVTATADFKFHNQYNNNGDRLYMYGNVSAAGHKMHVSTRVDTGANGFQTGIYFVGTIDADIEKTAQYGAVIFHAGSQIGANGQSLTLLGATNIAQAASSTKAAAHIGATTVTVDNTANKAATLRLCSRDNLDREAVIRLISGGKLLIDSGVIAKVGELWIDGVRQSDGYYKADTLPTAIGGAGKLRVGPPRGLMVICK